MKIHRSRKKRGPAWRAGTMTIGLWLLAVGTAVLMGIFDRSGGWFALDLPPVVALPMIALGAVLFLLPLPTVLLDGLGGTRKSSR